MTEKQNSTTENTSTQNPFIKAYQAKSWGTQDDCVRFDQLKIEHFLPALEQGIQYARENIQKIINTSEPPDFNNTIAALESASELQELSAGIYFNLFSAEASPELQALAKDISAQSAAFSSEVMLNEQLFNKIQAVYEKKNQLSLNTEEQMMLEKTHRSFVKNGALLNNLDKDKLKQIDQELSVLSPQFSENVLKATNAFEMLLENESDLAGLPESIRESSAHEAELKNKKGKWVFTLQAPSYVPFMQYSERRDLRKKMWVAFNSRALQGENNNQEVILKSVELRHKRAQLLGFKTHAEFTLTERMAETPTQVFEFLKKILDVSKPAADKDLFELKEFAQKLDGISDLMPWDFAFYSEKLKEKKYHFKEEELRPYFKLENVVQGVFEHAKRLYHLDFKKTSEIPKYHPDVDTYEVRDSGTGEYIGLFYTDFFPRPTKKDGAWMTGFREQGYFFGKLRRPHISIVCNFTKPTPTKPSLLSYDEVLTLFHEFGHALHGLLSQCHYRTVSGTNVYWDFVELPSQIMENWVKEKEGLDVFAKHYQTQELIPAELVEKIKKSHNFQSGYYSLRQINFANLDMAWHTTPPENIKNVVDFELKATEKTRTFPYFEGTCSSTSFSHIFAGGYSSGYYSYKWAEVLDADAFEFFKEKGIFNSEVSAKFKSCILSRGGTEHPMDLYKKFRGREPDPTALLKREGLIS